MRFGLGGGGGGGKGGGVSEVREGEGFGDLGGGMFAGMEGRAVERGLDHGVGGGRERTWVKSSLQGLLRGLQSYFASIRRIAMGAWLAVCPWESSVPQYDASRRHI